MSGRLQKNLVGSDLGGDLRPARNELIREQDEDSAQIRLLHLLNQKGSIYSWKCPIYQAKVDALALEHVQRGWAIYCFENRDGRVCRDKVVLTPPSNLFTRIGYQSPQLYSAHRGHRRFSYDRKCALKLHWINSGSLAAAQLSSLNKLSVDQATPT